MIASKARQYDLELLEQVLDILEVAVKRDSEHTQHFLDEVERLRARINTYAYKLEDELYRAVDEMDWNWDHLPALRTNYD